MIRPGRLHEAIARALVATMLEAADARAESGVEPRAVARLERVEVVGTHIAGVDAETSQPVFVLEREDIERTGLTTVGDVIQQLVVHGEALSTRVNDRGDQGGSGGTFVNLRNLGTNRTLVLLDGRRFVAGLDGAVDLSAIPLAIVDRIEVLKDGASAVYGSDAIAGVVNIATRSDYEGREANAYYGGWEQGDGVTQAYDFTLGGTGERATGTLGLSYGRQDAISAADRPMSAVPVFGLPPTDVRAAASGTTPFGYYVPRGFEFFEGLTLIPGRPGTTPSDFRPFDDATDGYNYAPENYLLTPEERGALFAQGRYPLNDSVNVGGSLLANRRRSEQLFAPSNIVFAPFLSGIASTIVVDPDNLYNPFGVPVDFVARRLTEVGGRRYSQEVDTTRYSLDLDGTWNAFGRVLFWDAHAIDTRAREQQSIGGLANFALLRDALGPSFVDAQGVARCGTPNATVAGCVPFNLFGGPGSVDTDMLAYVGFTGREDTETRLRNYAVNLAGTLATLPAGTLAFATGYEYRHEQGSDNPDPLSAAGLAAGTVPNREPTSGSTSVDELYLELDAPLLSGLRFAESLDLRVAARHSDYSSFGSTTNASVGLRWKPQAELMVRGNWTQGFRAPGVSELFLGTVRGDLAGVADPCAPDPPAPIPPELAARCSAAGVPAGLVGVGFTNATLGGNAALRPELAVTRTLGLVYSPAWSPGLDIHLDWYRIQIEDAIGDLDVQTIVDRCYLADDAAACARVTRADDGQIFDVDASLQNLPGGLETEGYDFTLDWRRSTEYGDFRLRWDSTYIDYYGDRGRPARLTRLPDGTLLQGNVVGTRPAFALFGSQWRLKSNLELAWSRGAWSAAATARYFSAIEEDCRFIVEYAELVGDPSLLALCDDPERVVDLDGDGVGEPAATREIDATWFLDLQAAWDAPWNARVTVGLRNALDQDPPLSYSAFANSFNPAYDIPGRFWYVGYSQDF